MGLMARQKRKVSGILRNNSNSHNWRQWRWDGEDGYKYSYGLMFPPKFLGWKSYTQM